jgi:hypothetical protein
MTDQETNIAIACALGWRSIPDEYYLDNIAWVKEGEQYHCATCDLPPYCSSLDAMASAEATLTDEQRVEYCRQLALNPCFNRMATKNVCTQVHLLISATARQRATAFLAMAKPQ